MIKNRWCIILSISLLFLGCTDRSNDCNPRTEYALQSMTDSLSEALDWPEDLKITAFAGPDLTPSPASMAVAPTGDVFVGVDKIGSLGKKMGEGALIRLQDCNHDGTLDSHTTFARLNNPRGIIAVGDKVFVLHTTFSAETKKATGMDLVVFEDRDHDGVADGDPQPLIEGISSAKYLRERGTDHATNGIRMGIDGWIYIAAGDFGFHNATDRSGNKMTMLGGGIVRVRSDGTEMEIYTHGLRNIYDVAIDPFMNIFTRGNTNDGGGWNVRFADQIQTGEYGYPVLFKHFTEEIIPALVDVGGGSGTGALYMDDDRWPKKYNHVPMMADWGRSYLFMHHLTADRGSFTQQAEQFIELPQITDVDIDAGGIMYLSAWDGAGYTGSPDIGYVLRVVPENYDYVPFPDLESTSVKELAKYLKSSSAKARLYAQFELLERPKEETASAVWNVAGDSSLPRELQVAGIFTYAQIAGVDGIDRLVSLTEDETVREFALRALADRKAIADQVPLEPFLSALNDSSDRVKIAAIVGLGRLGRKEAADALLQINVPDTFTSPEAGTEGPHATPNSEIIPSHVAVRALVNLNAVDAVVEELSADNPELALWVLRYMHDPEAVNGLISAYEKSGDAVFKDKILNTLARLYHKEAPFDASWWWSTRPDTHGPYYKTVEWESSPDIREFLIKQQRKTGEDTFFSTLNSKYRLGIDAFGNVEKDEPKVDTPVVDLEKIKNKKGQIGESSIEDVMLALDKIAGEPEKGKQLFAQQGCQVCHSVNKGEVTKGPFMGQIGGIMNKHQIAESILKPNASISQGFSTAQIETKDDKIHTGFITQESAEELVLRNITGEVTKIKKLDIASRKELETSMMPTGMVNALSYEEFASLVAFLENQK